MLKQTTLYLALETYGLVKAQTPTANCRASIMPAATEPGGSQSPTVLRPLTLKQRRYSFGFPVAMYPEAPK